MRMLRKNPNRADVCRSLSELSLLWQSANLENPAIADKQGVEDKPMQGSIKGLDGIRAFGDGIAQAGEAGGDAGGTRGAKK